MIVQLRDLRKESLIFLLVSGELLQKLLDVVEAGLLQ